MTLVVAALVVEKRRSEEELLGVQILLRAEVEGKDRELADTSHALKLEIAGHARTKKSLRHIEEVHNQDQVQKSQEARLG